VLFHPGTRPSFAAKVSLDIHRHRAATSDRRRIRARLTELYDFQIGFRHEGIDRWELSDREKRSVRRMLSEFSNASYRLACFIRVDGIRQQRERERENDSRLAKFRHDREGMRDNKEETREKESRLAFFSFAMRVLLSEADRLAHGKIVLCLHQFTKQLQRSRCRSMMRRLIMRRLLHSVAVACAR